MKDLGIFIMNAITEALSEGRDYTDYITASINPDAVENFNKLGQHQIEYKTDNNKEFRIKLHKG